MTSERRMERLERALGIEQDSSGPQVNYFLPDNGRGNPEMDDGPNMVRYDSADVPSDPEEQAAFFSRLRGSRPGAIIFLATHR